MIPVDSIVALRLHFAAVNTTKDDSDDSRYCWDLSIDGCPLREGIYSTIMKSNVKWCDVM